MGIISRLKDIVELPTVPEVLVSVQRTVHSAEGGASQLASVVGRDPALAAKILKIANSAYFGAAGRRISNITTAITRIGFREVGHIAMAVSVVRQFGRHGGTLEPRQFWIHSLAGAGLAEKVAAHCSGMIEPHEREQLFLAGLLHDAGILVYDQFFNNELRTVLDYAARCEVSFLAAEAVVCSLEPHPLVGGGLLELWKLDPLIVSGVRFHHDPSRAPQLHRRFCSIIAVVEYLLCNCSMGSFEGMMPHPIPGVLEGCDLCPEQLPALYRDALEAMEQAQEILLDAPLSAGGSLRLV